MLCPTCQKENEEGNRFCISCGSLLTASEEVQPSASEPTDQAGDDLVQTLQALRGELRRLREDLTLRNERLARINERLTALERLQGVATAPTPEPGPVSVAPPTHSPEPVPGDAEPAPPLPPSEGIYDKVREWDWEQILGGNWLARIGVLAIVIGVAFFLKLAFDSNWIGPTGRVVLGMIGGLAMLGGGQYWWKRYPTYAQALAGGGIALLYLSIFASFAIYGLIGLYPAVAFLLLVSMASAGLALVYDSMGLAIIGILGAFVAPFILGGFARETASVAQAGPSFQLLVYVMGVDLGVLALSTFRNWRWFTLLALIASLIAFGAWQDRYGDEAGLLTSEVGITLIFLIFVKATTLYHILWRRAPKAFDQSLMVLNAASYFGISLGLMWDDFRMWMGGFSLILALFYGGLAYVALKRSADNVRLSFFALGIALVFLTVAVPVQLGDRAWTTIAWAAEGTVLMWLSFNLRMAQLRAFSYAVFAIVAVRLLFFDTTIDPITFRPVINERFLAFVLAIAAMYVSGYLLWRGRETLRKLEKDAWLVYPVFVVAANLFSLWLLSAEVIAYFNSRLDDLTFQERFGATGRGLRNAQNLSLTALWALYAAALLAVGLAKQSRLVRLAALGLLAIPIAKVFVYDVFTLERVYRVAAFIGLGVLLLVGGYIYQRYRKTIKGFLLAK